MQDADGSHRLTQHHLMDLRPADPCQLTPVPFPRVRRCYPDPFPPPLTRPSSSGFGGSAARGSVATWTGPLQTLDTHGGGTPSPIFVIPGAVLRHGTASCRADGGGPADQDGCAVQQSVLYQLYHPIQSRSSILFVTDSFPTSGWPIKTCHAEPSCTAHSRGACGRSHAHISPATCTKGHDAPSQWGLEYEKQLCPTSMTLRGPIGHRHYHLYQRGEEYGSVPPLGHLLRAHPTSRGIRASSVDHHTTVLQHDWPRRQRTKSGSLCVAHPPGRPIKAACRWLSDGNGGLPRIERQGE